MMKVIGVALLVLLSVSVSAWTQQASEDDEGYFWQGNTQLKQAFDTALIALQVEGVTDDLFFRYGFGASYQAMGGDWASSSCFLSQSWDAYQWPSIRTVEGTLRKILETGVWKVLVVKDVKSLPYIDSTVNPSLGAYPELFRLIVERISKHYRRAITVQEVAVPTSSQNNNVFRALWRNLGDSTMIGFVSGGFSLHARRTELFQVSCPGHLEDINVFTRSGGADAVTSWTAFQAQAPNNKIAVIGEESKQRVSSLFPQSFVLVFNNKDDAFNRLTTRNVLAVVDVFRTQAEGNTGYNFFNGKFLSSAVAFFRQDADDSSEPTSSDIPSELDTPVIKSDD